MGVVRGGREALLTVRDVAAQLGVCAATVYRLVAEGQLAHVRVLNAIRIAPRDLEAFVEARRRPEVGGGDSRRASAAAFTPASNPAFVYVGAQGAREPLFPPEEPCRTPIQSRSNPPKQPPPTPAG